MKSILAINSNCGSTSLQPTVVDNLIEDLSISNNYNEIHYHQNDWYSSELAEKVGNDIHQYLAANIFLELISAQFLLIDAIDGSNLLSKKRLNYLDYLVQPNAFNCLGKEIEVIIFTSSACKHFIADELDHLIENLPNDLFNEINLIDVNSKTFYQSVYPRLKNHILKKVA